MYYIGIDLGGTNIAAAVVNERFEILGRGKYKTRCPRPAEEIADDMAAASRDALKEAGVDISYITRKMYRTQPMERVRLTRVAYDHMHFELENQVGVIELSREDFLQNGCTYSQADGLVNCALEVEGVRMAVLASEREEGIKLSLRAVEPDTVNDIAQRFGGGGHAQAAGCTIQAPLAQAVAMVLEAMKEKL